MVLAILSAYLVVRLYNICSGVMVDYILPQLFIFKTFSVSTSMCKHKHGHVESFFAQFSLQIPFRLSVGLLICCHQYQLGPCSWSLGKCILPQHRWRRLGSHYTAAYILWNLTMAASIIYSAVISRAEVFAFYNSAYHGLIGLDFWSIGHRSGLRPELISKEVSIG